jgi:hypothetical protein
MVGRLGRETSSLPVNPGVIDEFPGRKAVSPGPPRDAPAAFFFSKELGAGLQRTMRDFFSQ